jgi:hypothetical protein
MEQLELFPNLPVQYREDSIQGRFEQFHKNNPHVYRNLVKLARAVRQQNPHAKIGIAALFEELRWQYAIQTTDTDYRLNNNYRSRYARLIEEQEPDLKGIFETRRLRERV